VVVQTWIYIVSLQSLKQSGNVNQNSINMESIDLLFDKFKFKVYWQNQQKTCFWPLTNTNE